MAKVMLFLGPTETGFPPFQLQPKDFTLSRVPCLGEVIGLGNDEEGISSDYRVVLVHHIPKGLISKDVAAEVYAVRVSIVDMIEEVTPKEKWENP